MMILTINEVFCYITVAFGLCAVFIPTFMRCGVLNEGGPDAFPVGSFCIFLICTALYFGFALHLGNILPALELWLRCMIGVFIISIVIGLFVLNESYKLHFACACLIPGAIFGVLWFLARFYTL